MLVQCIEINYLISSFFFFFFWWGEGRGEIMTSLAIKFPMQKNPYSKSFLDVKMLFVNRFSKTLWVILGQSSQLQILRRRQYLYGGVS